MWSLLHRVSRQGDYAQIPQWQEANREAFGRPEIEPGEASEILIMNDKPLEPPANCREIPGFILELSRGGPWVTQDLQLTDVWQERGIWKTLNEALEAREAAFPNE